MKLFLGIVSVLVTAISGRRQQPFGPNGDGRANIVVILTDDQDLHMDSVDYMPLLKKHVIDHGTFYKHHYCSTAICCPSRVTLWTGRNAQNSSSRGLTKTGFHYGSKQQVTALIILGNFSMHIQLRIGTVHTHQVGHPRIFFLIHILTNISMLRSSGTNILQSATKANIQLMFWQKKPMVFLKRGSSLESHFF